MTTMEICSICGGSGFTYSKRIGWLSHIPGFGSVSGECPKCSGTGVVRPEENKRTINTGAANRADSNPGNIGIQAFFGEADMQAFYAESAEAAKAAGAMKAKEAERLQDQVEQKQLMALRHEARGAGWEELKRAVG